MLFNKTPIGYVQVPSWLEKELVGLSDDELLQKALAENNHFVISPATFAMIEKRFLTWRLQQMINPHVSIKPGDVFEQMFNPAEVNDRLSNS